MQFAVCMNMNGFQFKQIMLNSLIIIIIINSIIISFMYYFSCTQDSEGIFIHYAKLQEDMSHIFLEKVTK